MTSQTFDSTALTKQLKADAKALGIPSGSAEIFIAKTVQAVTKTLANKQIITASDLDRAVYKELKIYHPDLAFIYKHRDQIF